jgi:hypothetical protein
VRRKRGEILFPLVKEKNSNENNLSRSMTTEYYSPEENHPKKAK